MKKILMFVLAAPLILALAACFPKKEKTTEETTTTTTTSEHAAPAGTVTTTTTEKNTVETVSPAATEDAVEGAMDDVNTPATSEAVTADDVVPDESAAPSKEMSDDVDSQSDVNQNKAYE